MANISFDWRLLRSITAVAATALIMAGCGGGDGGGGGGLPLDETPVAAGFVRVHYYNKTEDEAGKNYTGWGVHNWNATGTPYETLASGWATPLLFNKRDAVFAYVDIALAGEGSGGLIVHKGDAKACGSDTMLSVTAEQAEDGMSVWIKDGDCTIYTTAPDVTTLALADARGHWLNENTVAFPGASASATYKLAVAANGGVTASKSNGIAGEDSLVNLTVSGTVNDDATLAAKFPHLKTATVLKLADADALPATVKAMLKGQVVLVQYNSAGTAVSDATNLQTAGVLDSLFAEAAKDEALGVTWNVDGDPVFKVWAPTAKSVKLKAFSSAFEPLDQFDGTPVAAATLRVHWKKKEGAPDPFDGSYYVSTGTWGVYSWSGPLVVNTAWTDGRFKFTAEDDFGALVDIPVNLAQTKIDFLVIDQGGDKGCGSDQAVVFNGDIATAGQEVWIDGCTISATNPDLGAGIAKAKPATAKKAPAAAAPDIDMTYDAATGVWTHVATGMGATWKNTYYYLYSVTVFNRKDGNAVKTYSVTDPYSLSLSANSARSLVADLSDAAVKPAGWDAHSIPANVAAAEDTSIYELHVRDFSVYDTTVPEAHRGKFLAFTDNASQGMTHLKALADAGLTTLHLLPVNDQSKINELSCVNPDIPAAAADAGAQTAAIEAVKDLDCFNWGYDPLHYTALEGSYSTNPADGKNRVVEFRQAVKNLHEQGLRVVIDVVYNHTPDSGAGGQTSLDKIVPDYYYRLDGNGQVTNSTCCSNTATENAMMGKLTIDSAITLATAYKLDGLRFDLMGHIPLAVMTKLKADVDAAAGRELYYYGEGWNFGEVENNQRFLQATQGNIAGTGIGTFSDRARDAIRGGSPFDSLGWLVANQGFINGAFLDPNTCNVNGQFTTFACEYNDNGTMKPTTKPTLATLLSQADLVRLGLAGTLKDFSFVTRDGSSKKGSEIDYNGQKAGYTGDPQEVINYAEKHDNQTLFDINAYKLPIATNAAERARVQNLGMALTVLSQGVPFVQAGMDTLRSKSIDRDSYNSGDWFNRIDWSYASNNFGVGAPNAEKNAENYGYIKPLLTSAHIKPTSVEIGMARDAFRDLLAIRKSTTLFRMRTAQDVMDRLKFYNTGAAQTPGVIVMELDGDTDNDNTVDAAGMVYKRVLVAFNVDKVAKNVTVGAVANHDYALHPVVVGSSDAVAKTATYTKATGAMMIPARSTVVWVETAAP